MASIASIIAQGVTPRTTGVQPLTPLDIQQQRAEVQARQAQAQTQQEQARQAEFQRQQIMKGQQVFQEVFSAPDFDHTNPKATAMKMIQRGAPPKMVTDWMQDVYHSDAFAAQAKENELQAENLRRSQMESGLQAVKDETDPAAKTALWTSLRSKDPSLPEQYPGDGHVQGLINYHKASGYPIREKAAAAEAAYKEAQTAEAKATTAVRTTEKEIKQRQLDMLKSFTPETAEATVDSIVDPQAHPSLNKLTKAQVQGVISMGGTMEEARRIVASAADQIERIDTAVGIEQAKALANATEDDYRREGIKRTLSGVMPSLGLSSAGRQKILHYSNEYERNSGLDPREVLQGQAAYKGDIASLTNLKKVRDQVVSFEKTAQDNLNLFIGLASEIPDTGVPWINSPLRLLDEKLVGSEHMAAVNAARQVANNEIARVTTQANAGGAVLSDSARKEVQEYNPNNATFKQTVALAKVLRQDMANRHKNLDETIGEISKRIGAPVDGQAPPATGPVHPAQAAGKEILDKGTTAAPAGDIPVGTVQPGRDGNYRFKGGDRYDKKNWELVQPQAAPAATAPVVAGQASPAAVAPASGSATLSQSPPARAAGVSTSGISRIKKSEGFSPAQYEDSGRAIGYGHHGPDLPEKVTEDEAHALLVGDLKPIEAMIADTVEPDLNQDQFDALASFGYNLGMKPLGKIIYLINEHGFDTAGLEMLRYTNSKGKSAPGLVARRREEAALLKGKK